VQNILPIISGQKIKGEWIIIILSRHVPFIFKFLQKHINTRFTLLSSIAGVDFLGKDYRFSIVYDLLSTLYVQRLRVKVFVNELTSLPSITPIFINANWWEREVWDLYGIFFEKHPDLRRILSDYGFEGYPMRKDFPLYGYIELRYDENHKRIVSEPVEFSQEFRFFDFETPW
jgi:NADH/F420H2 dehydrogenase subunit C